MTDIVTGTPAVVGFTNGHHDRHNHGITEKDQGYMAAVSRGEQTRDILQNQWQVNSPVLTAIGANALAIERTAAAGVLATSNAAATTSLAVEKTAAAVNLAVEKTAAATALAIEKTASAAVLEATKNAGAAALQAANNASAAMMFAAQNQAATLSKIDDCCCEVKALILSTDGQRIRDSLQVLQTQFITLTKGTLTPVAVG